RVARWLVGRGGSGRGDRRRWHLAFSSPVIGQEAVDTLLDGVELADVVERLLGDRRAVRGVHLEELAPGVCPTGGLEDAVAGEQLVETCVTIGMDNAAELFQVMLRMLAFAIRRVEEQCGWGTFTGEGPLVTDVNP